MSSDASALVGLRLRAYTGEEANSDYLDIALGPDVDGKHVAYVPLASHGFTSFNSGSPLKLDHSLSFAASFPTDISGFTKLLEIRDVATKSLPIAKLYYTVSMA